MDPGEKFPECLRNLGVLLSIFFFFFFSFGKLPTNQIERHCVQSALQLGIAENKPDATGNMQWD